jgi:hypothetical protein
MEHIDRADPEPVICPICGRPLSWTADRWLAVFECIRCGQFSDFSSLSSARGRRSLHRPSDLKPSES